MLTIQGPWFCEGAIAAAPTCLEWISSMRAGTSKSAAARLRWDHFQLVAQSSVLQMGRFTKLVKWEGSYVLDKVGDQDGETLDVCLLRSVTVNYALHECFKFVEIVHRGQGADD